MSSRRFAYAQFVGPIPDGWSVHHKCNNRICCNPAHLQALTQRENLLLGDTLVAANVAKTHCPAGHEYTEDNTYTYRSGRQCKACRRARNRVYKQQRRQQSRWVAFEPTVLVGAQ